MTTGTEQPNRASLYRKIAAVAGAIEAVEKDGQNKDQGYRYATPASVMSAIKPLLAAQALAIVPHLVDFAEIDTGQRAVSGKPFVLNRVSMHYHILDGETGEELVVPWQAQAGTYGDDKGLAKAQTIALRTFLIQLFQIPAEDPETDPDARDARDDGRTQQRQPARNAPQRQPTRTQQARLDSQVATYEPTLGEQPTNGGDKRTKREKMIDRIAELTEKANELSVYPDLPKPLDEMSDSELIAYGKKLGQAITEAKAREIAPVAAV